MASVSVAPSAGEGLPFPVDDSVTVAIPALLEEVDSGDVDVVRVVPAGGVPRIKVSEVSNQVLVNIAIQARVVESLVVVKALIGIVKALIGVVKALIVVESLIGVIEALIGVIEALVIKTSLVGVVEPTLRRIIETSLVGVVEALIVIETPLVGVVVIEASLGIHKSIIHIDSLCRFKVFYAPFSINPLETQNTQQSDVRGQGFR